MLLEVQLTVQDFLAAQRLHFRPKPALRWVLYLFLAVLAAMLGLEAWMIARGGVLPSGWWILPAGLAYGAFLFFILLPWRVARIFHKNPALAAPTRMTIVDQGLWLDSSRGQLRFGWQMLKRWKANSEMILVYHSGSQFHIFPRRCFPQPQDFQRLRELLGQHVGPAQV